MMINIVTSSKKEVSMKKVPNRTHRKDILVQYNKLKSQSMNCINFLEKEITQLQRQLLDVLQEEYTLRSRKELILMELENYQGLIDTLRKDSSDYQSQKKS